MKLDLTYSECPSSLWEVLSVFSLSRRQSFILNGSAEDREAIRYIHKNGQLHNQLATNLPHLVKKAVARVIADVLGPYALQVKDVKHWALHTGGEKILNTIKEEIGLSEEQLRASRGILSEYGNMSSPTVWFVLRKLMDSGIENGEWCIIVAFGAGLSAHAFLLRKCGYRNT